MNINQLVLWSTLQRLNGFDTTRLCDGDKSLGNLLSDESFKKAIISKSIEGNEYSIEVQALFYNVENNTYEVFHSFEFLFINNCETIVINLKENAKLSCLNKEIICNLLYFATKLDSKNLIMILNKKGKDYVKMLQGLMTVGFKTDNSNSSRFANYLLSSGSSSNSCKVLKMELTKLDEVQDIEF